MRRSGYIGLFLCLGLLMPAADAGTGNISREEIQRYLKQPGNAIISEDWDRNFQSRTVSWQGTVYKIDNHASSQYVEVLIKVLPSSYLYDTVLKVSVTHPMLRTIREGEVLRFQGVVTGAVDTKFLKEVHVTLNDGQALPYQTKDGQMVLTEPKEKY